MKSWFSKNGIEVIPLLYGRSNVFLVIAGEKKIMVDTSISLFQKKLLKHIKIKKKSCYLGMVEVLQMHNI